MPTLTKRRLQYATRWLSERDEKLSYIFKKHGYPPLWDRPPGFATMVHIVLEQQVSLASANATFNRLSRQLNAEVTPGNVQKLPPQVLRDLGFSRQKIAYVQALAKKTLAGFSFGKLQDLSDDEARASLLQHKGIGLWSADIYLSECLLRCDILPPGDIAMQEVFRVLHGLDRRPNHEQLDAQTQHWRPWRSVATRLLWHHYLSEKALAKETVASSG